MPPKNKRVGKNKATQRQNKAPKPTQKRTVKTPCDKVPIEALKYDLSSGAGKLIHEIKQLSVKPDPYTDDDLSMISPFFGVKCFTHLMKLNFSNEDWRTVIQHMTAGWGPMNRSAIQKLRHKK